MHSVVERPASSLGVRSTPGVEARLAATLLAVALASCSGSDARPGTGYPPLGAPRYPGCPPAGPASWACAATTAPPAAVSRCAPLHEGLNVGLVVDGVARSFLLTLPPGAQGGRGRWPVVFNWHGFGDSAENMVPLLGAEAKNPAFPFIMVAPEDTGLLPTTMPIGFDWDILLVTTMNREARLFDELLACLDEQLGVDRDRVYSVGFSAGAIVTDLLGVVRGGDLAAVATYSGGYFSNPANPPTLGLLGLAMQWPRLATPNRYPQLLVHGGEADQFSLLVSVARFDWLGANDVPYLNGLGHDVVHCNHGGPHRLPDELLGPQLVEFFAAHPRGAPSPWAHALPPDYPPYCRWSPGS